MVIKNKKMLIEKLTGIHSSKKSYYVELRKIIFETTKRNIQLEIINQLAKSIGIDMSFKEIIENVIHKLQTIVYFDILTLYKMGQEGQIDKLVFHMDNKTNLSFKESLADYEKMQSENGDKAKAALWHVVSNQESLLLNDLSSQEFLFPESSGFQKRNISSVIMIPLILKEKVIGVLGVATQKNFNEEDLAFLEQVSDHLAVCLENARLYSEVWQHKREWEITFSAVTDLLVFINQDCEIQKVNKAAVDFFTLKEKEILGKKCYRLFYGRESKCNPCLADQVFRTNKTAYLQSRTRHNRVLDILAYPAYTEEEKPYGVTYYAKDVTSLVDSIKFVSLGEMSAGVAHELNSPLTAIVGNSQLLLRETTSSHPHYQLIKDIQSCGVRCQRIIQNLLTFSRQEEYTFEKISLNRVVEKALSLLSYQIEKSKITIVKKLEPSLPTILGNAQGLEQIVINLLLNAKDAISDKMQKLEDQIKGEITITTGIQPGKFLFIKISDNGLGIDPEEVPHIFNPFYTTKRVGKGTGLGLSVSLGIAQAHSGILDVESKPGQGSNFSLLIPLHQK